MVRGLKCPVVYLEVPCRRREQEKSTIYDVQGSNVACSLPNNRIAEEGKRKDRGGAKEEEGQLRKKQNVKCEEKENLNLGMRTKHMLSQSKTYVTFTRT